MESSFALGRSGGAWTSPRRRADSCVPRCRGRLYCRGEQGLVGWWPGEGNADDIAGTNNGIMQGGGPTAAAGVVGLAFAFDGTNNYVQIPDAPTQRSTNFTIEAWVRFRSLESAVLSAPVGDQFLVFKQNSRSSGNVEGFDLSKTRIGNDHVFRFLISDTSPQNLAACHIFFNADCDRCVVSRRGGPRHKLFANLCQWHVGGPGDRLLRAKPGHQPGLFWRYGLRSTGMPGSTACWMRFPFTVALCPLSEIAAIYAADSAGKCKAVNITVQPQNQTVLAGTNASFTVTATGLAPLNYQWRFNGTNLASASGCDSHAHERPID